MRPRTASIRFAAAAFIAIAADGCSPNYTTPTPAIDASSSNPLSATTLKPVSAPDLSGITEPAVRDQIHERYASLMRKLQNSATPTAELGDAYGDMGKLLMAAAEHLDVAESCFLHAQTLMPNEKRWPYYLGHLYRTQGDLEKSAASFDRALSLQPDDVATLFWLGEVNLGRGRPEEAEPLLAKALSLQPGSVSARFGLGRAALAKKDYASAVKYLEDALTFGPQGASVHYPLAMAYRGLGDLSKAEAHLSYQTKIEILPADPLMQELDDLVKSSVAYELRGIRALNNRDWTAAAEHFRKGLEVAPANPSLRHRLGTALFQMGDPRGALEEFEEVVRVSPGYAKAHYSLGVLFEASGRMNEATQRFSAAVRYEPTYTEARLRLAGLLRHSGRMGESLSQYEQAIKIDPRVADGQFGYAITLVGLHRYQEARDRLNDALKLRSDQPVFAHALARVLAAAPDERVRNGRQALAVIQTLSDEQRLLDLGETMAMALAEVGRYEEAATWQRGAMSNAQRAGQHELAQRMSENLRLYEHRQPCRTPWRKGELP